MFGWIKKAETNDANSGLFERLVKLSPQIFPVLVASGSLGWAASELNFYNAYSPFSWILAAILGAILGFLFQYLFS